MRRFLSMLCLGVVASIFGASEVEAQRLESPPDIIIRPPVIQPSDSVTLFSSGSASFQREIYLAADQNQKVRITVSSENLADVLGSLTVTGDDVTLVRPPTFPLAAEHNPNRLVIDPSNGLESLATRLSGAKVTLSPTGSTVTLVGMDSSDGKKYLVTRTDDGRVLRTPLENAQQLEFADKEIQAEIDRALARNIAAINPATTVIELELYSKSGGLAQVQYTHAAAAWTLSYRLKETAQGYVLEGHAIVHNNTAEDWANANLKLVVGKPIDFKTDIAKVKVPERETVNLVDENAPSSVQSRSMRGQMMERSSSPLADFAPMASAATASAKSAFDPMASTEAVGSYVEYRALRPLTIQAGHSADVPVLTMPLKKSASVLYYKQGAQFPYQAVRLNNESETTLGKGVCAVFNSQGTFDGRAILETTPAGEAQVLPHKVENRVSVKLTGTDHDNELLALELANGVFLQKQKLTSSQTYSLSNATAHEFSLLLTVPCRYPDSTLSVSLEGATVTREGFEAQIEIPLTAGDAEVTVTEVYTQKTELSVERQFSSVQQYLRSFSSTLGEDALARYPGLQIYLGLQLKIDELQQKQRALQRSSADLEKEVAEVRQNLEAIKGVNATAASKWGEELATSFETLRKTRTEVRDLADEIAQKQQQQRAALASLVFTWER